MKYAATLTVLVVVALGAGAADKPARAKGKPDDVFGITKVHEMHLTVTAKDWETMAPTRPGTMGFGPPMGQPPVQPKEGEDRKPRGGFGNDFAWVKGDLEVNGVKYKEIGVRFKGNSTYMSTARGLNRPLKIDFDRHDEAQTFNGVKKISLNNHVMDPSVARDTLAFALYRAAGLATPRTAYVQLLLTIPGKYDKEFVGLYTMVESVDKPFLKDRFGSAKGLLLKPERVGPLEYLGDDWKAYEARYQPKTEGDDKSKRRLIDLTKLIHRADDATFRTEIGNYLDVDNFVRYLAVSVMLSSIDSFMGIGHNYYLYLDPKTNKFLFIPWDCDHAFGGFAMMGTKELMDLSIKQPNTMKNRLIERLFAEEKTYAAYKGEIDKLLKKSFTVDKITKDYKAIEDVIAKLKEKEQKAAKERKETGGFGPGFGPPGGGMNAVPDLATFVTKRVESLESQLAGKSTGTVLANRFGPGPGGPGGFGPGAGLARPILENADTNKDGKLTVNEITAAAKALFKKIDSAGIGSVDEKALVVGIEKILPPPPNFGGPGGMRPAPSRAEPLTKGIMARAAREGTLAEAGLLKGAAKLFDEVDKDKDGKLDDKEVAEAIKLIAPPPGGFGFGPETWLLKPLIEAIDTNKDGQVSWDEVQAAARALYKKVDTENKGALDDKTMTAGIEKLLPAPGFGGPGGGRPRGPSQAEALARGIMEKAGKDGKLTEAALVKAAVKLFTDGDKNKDVQLDETELTQAIQQVAPPPQFVGFGPEVFVMRPLLDGADSDKDGKLTRDEVTTGAKALFKKADVDSKGTIDEPMLAKTIDALWPKFNFGGGPGGGGGARPAIATPAEPLAKGIMEKAGKNGKLTEAALIAAAVKLFDEMDRNKDGKLEGSELTQAIQQVMPQGGRPMPPMPPMPPREPKEEKK